MQRKKITNADVERFPSSAEDKAKASPVLWDGELKGFGVRYFAATQTRTYFLQFRVKGGKEKHIKIGRHNDPYRVDQARAKALELKVQMVTGVDPVEQQREQQEAKRRRAKLDEALATTLKQVMEHYIEHKRTKHGPLRQRTKDDIRRHTEVNMADWIDLPVSSITRDMCLGKFIAMSAGGPTQANTTMRYARALFNHAKLMHETPDGQFPILASNPVTAMFRLRKPNVQKPRTRRVPLNKVGAVWLMLRRRADAARTIHERTAADWVSTMMLTGMRATESGSLKWEQCDMESRTIRLLGDVVKNHNEMLLPMSDTLYEILKARQCLEQNQEAERRRRRTPQTDVYVFATNGIKCPHVKYAPAVMEAVARAAGCSRIVEGKPKYELSPHDLRRTAEDIAKACKVDADERRQLLNHLASDVHGQAYSNNPDPEVLRPAVNSIAKYVVDASRIAQAQEDGSNVIRFPTQAG